MAYFNSKAPSLSITLISFIVCFGMVSEGFPISSPIPLNRQNDIVNVTELSPHLRNANWNLTNLSQYQANNISLSDNGVTLAYDKDTYAGGDQLNLTSESEYYDRPSIKANRNGKYMISWEGDTDLYAQLFNEDGSFYGNKITVCATGTYSTILCDSDNNFLIFFQDNYKISCRKYDEFGNKLGSTFEISEFYNSFNPKFAIDSNDNIWIIWIKDTNTNSSLLLQEFDSNGNPINNPYTIHISDIEIDGPRIVVNKNDSVFVAWYEWDWISNYCTLYFQIFTPDGTPSGALHEYGSNDSAYSSPSATTDSNGDFILALRYQDLRVDPKEPSQILVQKIYSNDSVNGSSFGPLWIENQSKPSVVIDKDGMICLAWTEEHGVINDTYGSYYANGSTYIQRFTENGTFVGKKTMIESHEDYGAVIWLEECPLPSGEMVVVWTDYQVFYNSYTSFSLRQFQKGAYAADGTLETPDFEVPDLVSWGNFSVNATYMNPARNFISSYYSINSGLNWSAVPANMNLSKANTSTGKIRFRIELSTTDFRTSPILNSFSLNYTVNKAPVILSLAPDNITDAYRQETIQFAVAAMDPENDSLTYDWAQTAGPEIYIDGNGTDSASVSPSELGFYQFRLTLWDGHAHSLPAFANITVVNRPPSLRIWGDGVPFKLAPYQLHGDITDPDADPFTWNWSILQSPQGTVFNDTDPLNPAIQSPVIGNCSVLLQAIDSLGAASDLTYNFTFVGHPPVSALAVNRTQARPGGYFGFTANASFDTDNDSLSYSFDFGDGNNSGWIEVSNASHQYSTPGHYSATVTVRDTDGNISAPASVSITILPFDISPTVTFTYKQGNLSVPFQFSGIAVDPDGTIVSLSWDFGDGTNATGANVQHQYKEGGNFTVRLTAVDNDGASVTAEKAIKVNRPPNILSAVPASPINLKWGQHVNLSVTAVDPDGDTINYVWSVDGQKVGGDNPAYDFSSVVGKIFNITVAVDDSQGEVVAHSWNVTVLPKTTGSNVVVGPVLSQILIIVLVLVVAAAIISIVLFRRWKRKDIL